jgi:hypothetical protein
VSTRSKLAAGRYRGFVQAYSSNGERMDCVADVGIWGRDCVPGSSLRRKLLLFGHCLHAETFSGTRVGRRPGASQETDQSRTRIRCEEKQQVRKIESKQAVNHAIERASLYLGEHPHHDHPAPKSGKYDCGVSQ